MSTGPNEVWLDEFNRWASPLQDNLGRAVAENLVAMLGTPHVTVFPQTLSADAEYRVAIEGCQLRIGAREVSYAGCGVDFAGRAKDGRIRDPAHHRA